MDTMEHKPFKEITVNGQPIEDYLIFRHRDSYKGHPVYTREFLKIQVDINRSLIERLKEIYCENGVDGVIDYLGRREQKDIYYKDSGGNITTFYESPYQRN